MKKSKMILKLIVGLLCLLQTNKLTEASGIFELSLTALVDSLGRDLRDDCCAWQNATANQMTSQTNHNHHQIHTNHNHHQHHNQAQPVVSCDPSKCQLIIRICVKNYQTQIEPSQCTFGELSAQVLKQLDQGDLLLPTGNSLPVHYQAPFRGLKWNGGGPKAKISLPTTNIHQQRMLSQTQAVPFLYQQQQQQQQSHQSAAAAARNPHLSQQHHQQQQQQQHQQQLRSPLSGHPRALRTVAFNQPISFPFNFTWPGSFSLIIDAWFESPLQQVSANHLGQSQSPTTTYDLYKRQLIITHSMRGWLAVKNEWTNDVHKTDTATLAYSYRVTCQPNYYGDQCNILCRPRDDFYGHYTCSQQGNIVCLPGWQGSYCLEPICSPGCHQGQGNCSRPNECSCRHGWQGPACEQCVLYPGCVHGSCNKPHECICDEGWGGLLCNEDLNFCANYQPCKNDGICSNTFDSNGVGSYTCTCAPGFAGKNCERRNNSQAPEQDLGPSVGLTFSNISVATQLQEQPQVMAASNGPTVEQQPSQQQPIQQKQQQQQQQVPLAGEYRSNNKQANKQAKSYLDNQAKYNNYQNQKQQQALGGFHYPINQATSAQSTSGSQQPLDSWVMISWAVIMICSIILVLVFSFRTVIERAGQRGQWQHQHHHQDGANAEDVATLQNQQNLCKSRTSLNATAAANMMADHKSAAYERVLSLVDGHEHMANIYGSQYGYHHRQQPGTSAGNSRFQSNSGTGNNVSSSAGKRVDKAKKSHQRQQYHNLHATHHDNSNLDTSSSSSSSSDAASSSSSEALAPPPPYTIAQSTHSYPNLAYQTLSSHYSSAAAAAASAYYLPLPATTATTSNTSAAGQRAPKSASQVTAISNAIYGGYSTYAGIPVVAAAATSGQQPTGADGSGGSNSATAAANQSAQYIIYPVHFMAS